MKTVLAILAIAIANLIILATSASAGGGGGTAGSSGGSTWAMGYYGRAGGGWASAGRIQAAVMSQNVAN